MKNRPSWDEYFMTIAENVATRSTCTRRKVGAVIVKNKQILATGYNGAPKNVPHCTPETCIRQLYNVPSGEKHELCRGLHAEQNAIIQAACHGTPIKGAIIYITHQPCIICTKMLINSEITTFIYKNPYDDSLAREMMQQADINIKIFNE